MCPAWNPASVWEEKAASQDRILQGCFDILLPPFVNFVDRWSLLLRSPQKIHAVVFPAKPCLCTHHIRWDVFFSKLLKRRWKTIVVFRVARLCENGICQSHHVLDELIKLSDADPDNLELFGISNVTTMDDGSCLDRILRIPDISFFPLQTCKMGWGKGVSHYLWTGRMYEISIVMIMSIQWKLISNPVFIFRAFLRAANLEVLPDLRLSSKVISTVVPLVSASWIHCFCDAFAIKKWHHQFLGETYYTWSCNSVVTHR